MYIAYGNFYELGQPCSPGRNRKTAVLAVTAVFPRYTVPSPSSLYSVSEPPPLFVVCANAIHPYFVHFSTPGLGLSRQQ